MATNKLGMVVYACDLSYSEAVGERSRSEGDHKQKLEIPSEK
jgi:hypothetical protein